MTKSMILTGAVVLAAVSYGAAQSNNSTIPGLPEGAVYINPLEYNVLGPNSTWYTERNTSDFIGFNPTQTAPPFFQVFDPSFVTDVLGPGAQIRKVASSPGYALAHEAPVHVSALHALFFSSNDGGPEGYNGWYNNSVVSWLNVSEVEQSWNDTEINVPIHTLTNLSDLVQMVNGGTGTYKGNILFATSGRAESPPSIVAVNPFSPYNVTVMLDNFYGRQFNSLNDLKFLPGTEIIYFTDPAYGYLNGFRPEPKLPSQVYRFDPSTGQVRAVADQFVNPNGIAFTGDGQTAYVTDTGSVGGFLGNNDTYPATIYQYDVDPTTGSFMNRRVFAYTDSGIPDGIQLDTNGNVYSGCGEGTHVWNSNGTLIGKFYLNSTTAEMLFTAHGLFILDEEVIYYANITATGVNLTVP
ncbi:calcium-dependent phosphotriesterase [Coniophora puteana RWD-64-598 SS2]|uniref:Calcium-dependent phosphotriesterase n=1 Tax=Coniophora puteana (strain RWD-64-598) TaxID=741705 RepID=A0A5M3M8Y8_CONPW|nr:calcium-dependent phosphotriesterase [Coniophora puteana RWD-64-598 SS2]EIW75732.1 calcium-dependent phosphotriesterase [Coniophora puteana RWD-64-598 SS2]